MTEKDEATRAVSHLIWSLDDKIRTTRNVPVMIEASGEI